MSKTWACKLCGSSNKPAKAHIVPKWAFRKITASGHAVVISADQKAHDRKTRNGIWDRTIVCEKCERSFSECDRYAKHFFMDTDWGMENFEWIQFEGVSELQPLRTMRPANSDLIRRFAHTTFWRAAHSKQGTFDIIRPDDVPDDLQHALLAGTLLSEDIMPCAIVAWLPSMRYPEISPSIIFRNPGINLDEPAKPVATIHIPGFTLLIGLYRATNDDALQRLATKGGIATVIGGPFGSQGYFDGLIQKVLANATKPS